MYIRTHLLLKRTYIKVYNNKSNILDAFGEKFRKEECALKI